MTRTALAGSARLARLLLFTVGYALAIALSDRVYGALAVPSPFWLPDTVLLVTLLRTKSSDWGLVLLATVPARLLAGVPDGLPPLVLAIAMINNGLKGVASAWWLTRRTRHPVRLDTMNEFLLFLGIAALVVPLASTLAVVPVLYSGGFPVWTGAYRWLLGDVVTQVVATPTLLYWLTGAYRQLRGRLTEFLVLLSLLLGALLAAFVLGGHGYSVTLLYMPVPFLIWAAVRLGPFGTANAISIVGIVSMVAAVHGSGVFGPEIARQSVLSLQLFLLVLSVPLLCLAILVAERERLRDREADFNSRLLEAQDHERARIARDLHDDLAQRMAFLHVGLETVGRSGNLPAHAEDELKTLSVIVDRMSIDLRQLSHRLHPSTLDLVGLESAIRRLCAELEAQHGMRVDVRCVAVPHPLERDLAICVFRIAQEALRNVVKHSGVHRAVVELSSDGERIVLCVSDAGVGFDGDVPDRTGLGLVSMRERLRPVGGSLSIESAAGCGTRVRAEAPLRFDEVSERFVSAPERWEIAGGAP